MDSVRSGPFGQIFRPDNFIFGQVGLFLPSQIPPDTLISPPQHAQLYAFVLPCWAQHGACSRGGTEPRWD